MVKSNVSQLNTGQRYNEEKNTGVAVDYSQLIMTNRCELIILCIDCVPKQWKWMDGGIMAYIALVIAQQLKHFFN